MTSSRSVLALGVLALGLGLAFTAIAQPQRASPPRPPGQTLPEGSYLRTCRGADLRGNLLSAQCPQPSGAPIFSTIDVNSCRGRDIANDRGYLRCSGGPVPPRPPVPMIPAGSYQQTCRNPTQRGNILTAVCLTRAGGRRTSSINVNTCRNGDIGNVNGFLTCGVRPTPPVPPKPTPPGIQAIAYAQPNYRGAKLIIDGPIPDLAKRGFDNRIQSLTIIRGRAEVCVDANYRGRCVRFTKSEPDIRTYRLFNSISSIR